MENVYNAHHMKKHKGTVYSVVLTHVLINKYCFLMEVVQIVSVSRWYPLMAVNVLRLSATWIKYNLKMDNAMTVQISILKIHLISLNVFRKHVIVHLSMWLARVNVKLVMSFIENQQMVNHVPVLNAIHLKNLLTRVISGNVKVAQPIRDKINIMSKSARLILVLTRNI